MERLEERPNVPLIVALKKRVEDGEVRLLLKKESEKKMEVEEKSSSEYKTVARGVGGEVLSLYKMKRGRSSNGSKE